MRSTALLWLAGLALLGAPRPAAAAFAEGDLYLLTTDDPTLGKAIFRIDPVSGAASSLLDIVDASTAGSQLAYDPFRDRLLYRDDDAAQGIRAVDSIGNLTTVAAGLTPPVRVASRGDGILYLWYSPSNPFRYLDAADTAHDVLDQAGSGPLVFPLGASVDVMLYHASTNSIILITAFGFSPCPSATNDTCAIKVPLTPDGTQVAGPLLAAQIDVASSDERAQGIGYGPGDTIFVAVDTNDNGQEPRLQLLDPDTMTLSTFASPGAFSGAAVLSAGTYSSISGLGLVFNTFVNEIRAYALGSSGAGTTFATGLSGVGHSESARLVEIWAPETPPVPALTGPLLAVLAALLVIVASAAGLRREA